MANKTLKYVVLKYVLREDKKRGTYTRWKHKTCGARFTENRSFQGKLNCDYSRSKQMP